MNRSELNPQSMTMSLILVLTVIALAGCGGSGQNATTSAPPPPPPEKIKVTALDELPVHTYELQGSVSEMLESDEIMSALRQQFRRDVESDLAKYQIDDAATLQGKYRALLTLDMVDGNDEGALARLDQIVALEDKEASRLMTGLSTRSLIAARGKVGTDAADEQLLPAFQAEFAKRVNELPWDVVQDQVKSGKARAEFMSENLLLGMVQSRLEPTASAAGELSADLAGSLIGIRYALDRGLKLNPAIAEVYTEYIANNDRVKANIWPERDLVLPPAPEQAPVVIGIWDSGVDAEVFGERMFVNAAEAFDGKDTDSNGFVDDVHGIAFDLDGLQSPDLLHPLGDQAEKLDKVYEYAQGFADLTAAVESEEGAAVRKQMSTMEPGDVGEFLTTLSFGGLYMHGTHVAGIAAAGNPFARILVARITFDYHTTPQALTVETAKRLAEDYRLTTEYFRTHGVRVVNMSWGWTFKEIESGLEANGVGDSAEERAKLAREMIDILSEGLHGAMAATPEILYVTAAGNDDNDVEFDVVIPSNFELANLMVIGAVDQAGDPTGFTSGGRNVRVYANGFRVDSDVPGGGRMKMSGTSMASPNVCNLAAKLITLDPALQPDRVIELIEQGADAHAEHGEILLMNPLRSAELLAK